MSTLTKGVLSFVRRNPWSSNFRQKVCLQSIVRHKTTTEAGGMLPEPFKMRFGLLKVVAVSVPFLYLGATISKEGAALLEDYDIFIPEDDDD